MRRVRLVRLTAATKKSTIFEFIVHTAVALDSPIANVADRKCFPLKSFGASAVKEPGHFEVRKSSSQVTRSQGRSQYFLWGCTFSSKKIEDLF